MEKYLRDMSVEEKVKCVTLLLEGRLLYRHSPHGEWVKTSCLTDAAMYKASEERFYAFKEQVMYKPLVHGNIILTPSPLPIKPQYADEDWTTCDSCFMNQYHPLVAYKDNMCPVDADGNLYCESCKVAENTQSVTQVVYKQVVQVHW